MASTASTLANEGPRCFHERVRRLHVLALSLVVASSLGCGASPTPVQPVRRSGSAPTVTRPAAAQVDVLAPSGPPHPPGTRPLFARQEAPDPEAALRQRLLRAVQRRHAEWAACYAPVLCDDAEPPRVVIDFTLGADGRVIEAHATSVTRFVEADGAVVQRSGDVDVPFARCLAEVIRGLTLEWRGEGERTLRYPFLPERAGCPP